MNWYKKIQAATLPMNDLAKAIRGTLKNMIPGISQVKLDYIFTNQEAGQPRSTILESKSPFWSSKYPILYCLFVNTRYLYEAQSFNTDGPAEGVSYTVHMGINMDFTLSMLEKYPEYKSKILGLIEKMRIGKYSGIDIVYEADAESLYGASAMALEFIRYFESMIDNGGNEDDDEDTDPWFPGDPSADYEFEQEELAPVRNLGQSYIPKPV